MKFIDKYEFLSNFYTCPITITINNKILIYRNVQAAFEAHKNIEIADKYTLLTGYQAMTYGKKLPIKTPNWETEQYFIMAKILHAKFSSKTLLDKLQTMQSDIVNENYWNDTLWGVCKGEGKNILGKMLMIIRDSNNSLESLIKFIETEILKLYN